MASEQVSTITAFSLSSATSTAGGAGTMGYDVDSNIQGGVAALKGTYAITASGNVTTTGTSYPGGPLFNGTGGTQFTDGQFH